MKRRNVLFIVLFIIIIFIFAIFLILQHFNNSYDKKTIIEKLDERDIVSRYNDYALVMKHLPMLDEFYIYKKTEYLDYELKFNIPELNIESRFVCWINDKIYILNKFPVSYSLIDGKKMDIGEKNLVYSGSYDLQVTKVVGHDGEYIYYEYNDTPTSFAYGKIDFELKNPIKIQKEDIPKTVIR